MARSNTVLHTNKRFKIKYYGDIFEEYQLICGTDFAPELIYAVDVESNEEILLFDGTQHGYDPMFCDEFTHKQITERPLIHFYKDQDNQDHSRSFLVSITI